MKKKTLQIILLLGLMSLTGCSFLTHHGKTEPTEKFVFQKIEIEPFEELEPIKKIDLTGKLSLDENKSNVITPVNLWSNIRKVNDEKDKRIKIITVRELIYKKAYEGCHEQIDIYMRGYDEKN